VDAAIALSVVPVIIGLVVLALRLGLPPIYETPLAVALGMAISLSYALATQFPGGTLVADALLRDMAVGLTTAGLIATVRRIALAKRARRRKGRQA
jgi:hypothetical protein